MKHGLLIFAVLCGLAASGAAQTTEMSSRRTFTVGNVTFTMIGVQGGTFNMGCSDEYDMDCPKNEKKHKVTLSDYMIGETEVTQELWNAVMDHNPSEWKGENLPVENVSWIDCHEFIKKLNAMIGYNDNHGFSLPTEAEWEYASRGGRESKGYEYSGSDIVGTVAWYSGDDINRPHIIRGKRANELGIYDMSGNVQEWCDDYYYDYTTESQINPKFPTPEKNVMHSIVVRGGCYGSRPYECRVSCRGEQVMYADDRADNTGFRLAFHP